MLLCGLDFSGKTTLIKRVANDLNEYASKFSIEKSVGAAQA